MTIWRPQLAHRTGPKFRQISDAIGEAIGTGEMRAGTRMPPQRDLAHVLGVSLNTVSRAYADAADRGFVCGEVGRGTYVRDPGPVATEFRTSDMTRPQAGPIDFSLNLPASGPAAEALAEALSDLSGSRTLNAFLDYRTLADQGRETEAAAHWLGRVGLDARSDDVVLTSGGQHGILVALMATTRPGDVLLTESLTYQPITAMAHHLGLKVAPVASEDGVLTPDALDAACERVAGRVLYCLPTLHTPTTATLDSDRRSAIAAIAHRRDLTLIEDDVFGMLPPKRPLPLACFAPERTIYITSVSKSLAPGLRVGYVHAPPAHVQALRSAVQLTCWMPPPLMAEIASRWIEDGTADALNAFQREEAAARQAMAKDLMPSRHISADPHGFHVWLTLPPGWHPDVFRMAAQARGVNVMVGGAFAVAPSSSPNAVRLCLSYEVTRARVHTGLSVLAELLQDPGHSAPMVL